MCPNSTTPARTWLYRGFHAALDVLFPPACAVCGTPGIDGSERICRLCEAALESQYRIAYCPACARTVPPFVVAGGRCNRCRERKMRVAGVVRAGPYEEPFRAILRAFKYHRRWSIGRYLAGRLTAEFEHAPWFESIDALVTVPPWWPRRIVTGDYPPAILARGISGRTGVPLIPALRRIKGGPSQIGLTELQRIQNVRGKFAVTPGVRIAGATLCLVDDVMTTGATLDECARILLGAGAAQVYAGVLARAARDTPSVTPSA
ncbi:MAG: ComF family protein [Planctomycetota bacterium]